MLYEYCSAGYCAVISLTLCWQFCFPNDERNDRSSNTNPPLVLIARNHLSAKPGSPIYKTVSKLGLDRCHFSKFAAYKTAKGLVDRNFYNGDIRYPTGTIRRQKAYVAISLDADENFTVWPKHLRATCCLAFQQGYCWLIMDWYANKVRIAFSLSDLLVARVPLFVNSK